MPEPQQVINALRTALIALTTPGSDANRAQAIESARAILRAVEG